MAARASALRSSDWPPERNAGMTTVAQSKTATTQATVVSSTCAHLRTEGTVIQDPAAMPAASAGAAPGAIGWSEGVAGFFAIRWGGGSPPSFPGRWACAAAPIRIRSVSERMLVPPFPGSGLRMHSSSLRHPLFTTCSYTAVAHSSNSRPKTSAITTPLWRLAASWPQNRV